MAAIATFALKAGVWFRRGRLLIVSPDSLGTACPLSGRNSTYRPVQISETSSIRSTERITGIHRDTIMRLGARVGRGCAELHDRMMVGIRTGRLEFDELWSYVGKKQKQ